MEEIDLTASEYWEGPGVDIRLNPRLDFDTVGLRDFIETELGIEAAIVFATSGSTGSGPKFVILEKRAVLASAEAVNRHLEVTKDDRWLCALTTFHVGGLGVWARAWKAGCSVFGIGGERWDQTGRAFVEACRIHKVTLTALTPTHLHDVITNRHRAPGSLRAVLIGGAALEEPLLRDAIDLGWPILRTFGMTETASQIATDRVAQARDRNRPDSLPLLSGWEGRMGEGERLEIRGDALLTGYAIRGRHSRAWKRKKPFTDDGFFATGDCVELHRIESGGTGLVFQGRSDDQVKKLGERVSLERIRKLLRECLAPRVATIVTRPHERMGNELVAVFEGEPDLAAVAEELDTFQERVAPFERIDRVEWIDRIPRTEIGKIAHGRLVDRLFGNGLR